MGYSNRSDLYADCRRSFAHLGDNGKVNEIFFKVVQFPCIFFWVYSEGPSVFSTQLLFSSLRIGSPFSEEVASLCGSFKTFSNFLAQPLKAYTG